MLKMLEIFNIDNKPSQMDVAGNKAFNLFCVREKVSVPDFIVLHSDLMNEVLELPENKEIFDKLKIIWIKKLSIESQLSEIRNSIENISIPASYMEKIYEALKKYNITGPYAVRSSSIYEDLNSNSAPGVYETVLNVSLNDLEAAIKTCWKSNFSFKTVYYYGNNLKALSDIRMGVIIQTMKYGDISGIMFTANPVTGKKEIIVEIAAEISEKLTDGEITGKRIIINPFDNSYTGNEKISDEIISKFVKLSEILRNTYNKELDIEWCIKGSDIYVIQVRPITTISQNNKSKNGIYSISEIDALDAEGTFLARRVKNWQKKKYHFCKCCDELNIPHLTWYFLENYNEQIKKEFSEKLKTYKGEFVTIGLNETFIDTVKRREEVIPFLDEVSSLNKEKFVVSIRDIPMNELSIISRKDSDGTVYLEAIEGVMKGLKTGELTGSVYRINEKQEIIYKKECHNKEKFVLEFPSGKDVLKKNDITSFLPYENVFKQIAEFTRKLYSKGQIGSIEWWYCSGNLIAADISLEKNSQSIEITDSTSDSCTISNGTIKGKVFLLTKEMIDKLNQLSFGIAISVDRIDESLLKDNYLKQIIDQIKSLAEKGPVILAVKRPYLGIAPLLQFVNSVIFEEASLLCHLSVILREKQIPAVSIGNKFIDIENGKIQSI